MNYSDMEGVTSILTSLGCYVTREAGEADLWLVMTCSIREGAENKVWSKLSHKKKSKMSGRLPPSSLWWCWAAWLRG